MFEVDGPVDEFDDDDDDELLFANGDGRLVCLIDGKRLGRGDIGAIGG